MKTVARLIVNAIALYIVAHLISGVIISDFWAALVAVIVISIVNTFLKPILILFTLPITILTLGLFTFVINALLLLLASSLTPGFEIEGFFTALVASILYSIVSTLLNTLVK